MKKRFVSFVLVMAMAMGLVSSGFAAGASDVPEPMRDPNRYRYEYVEDEEWGVVKEFTITEAEAKDKEVFKDTLTKLISKYFTWGSGPLVGSIVEEIIAAGVEFASSADPYQEWGVYTVYQKYGYRYQVDRITGKRTVQEKYLIVHCELNQDGKTFESDHRLRLK